MKKLFLFLLQLFFLLSCVDLESPKQGPSKLESLELIRADLQEQLNKCSSEFAELQNTLDKQKVLLNMHEQKSITPNGSSFAFAQFKDALLNLEELEVKMNKNYELLDGSGKGMESVSEIHFELQDQSQQYQISLDQALDQIIALRDDTSFKADQIEVLERMLSEKDSINARAEAILKSYEETNKTLADQAAEFEEKYDSTIAIVDSLENEIKQKTVEDGKSPGLVFYEAGQTSEDLAGKESKKRFKKKFLTKARQYYRQALDEGHAEAKEALIHLELNNIKYIK